MTPQQKEAIKEEIKQMNDREVQNAILLKLTQLQRKQIGTAEDIKRAATGAMGLFIITLMALLISVAWVVSVIDKVG